MRRMKSFLKMAAFPLCVLLVGIAVPTPAHAYVDPSSGSLFAQAAIGSFMGAMAVAKIYARSIVASIRKFFRSRGEP